MKDWLKLKKYTHITPQLRNKHTQFIRSYVSDPKKVSQHRFFPFIHYTIKERKFRRATLNGVRQPLRSLKEKKREIYYANHLDAQIFAYYSHLLSERLSTIYDRDPELSQCVIAYRAIPFNNTRNKCNIDFAHEVFEFINKSTAHELVAVCFDVKSFFDSLDHKIIKKSWANILEQIVLPVDHYKVFRAITKFSYVEISELISEFEELKIKKLQYLPLKDITSFCKSGSIFRERVRNKGILVVNNNNPNSKEPKSYGIPQGSPISATISNLYMLNFDKVMCRLANQIGGIYRRYSDDILFICQPEQMKSIESQVMISIDMLNLKIQEEKTQRVFFNRNLITGKWSCVSTENGLSLQTNCLSYLGFNFDGKRVLIRPKSLSLYYRQLKRMIRRKAFYAKAALIYNKWEPDESKKKDPWIYRHRIYKSKSHLGARRKKINGRVYWGNYISYMSTASEHMNQPTLKRQIRNHWRIIEREIANFELAYELKKTPSKRRKTITS